MSVSLVLPLAAVLLLGTGVAFAEPSSAPADNKGAGHERPLAEMDADKDGAISADESAAQATKKFDEIDKDKDGSVSLDELDKYRDAEKAKREAEMKKREGEMKQKYRAKVDPDGDGKITKDEFLKSAAERQKKMDVDGDGKVTKEEAMARRHTKQEAHKEKVKARQGESRTQNSDKPRE